MRLSVIGLGYVGSISAACLAARGHHVDGVDIRPDTVAGFALGRPPVVEPGLDQLTADAVAGGRLAAGSDTVTAVAGSEVSLVCVPSPSTPDGGVDTTYLERAVEQIAAGLAARGAGRPRHTVVLRSTMPPGTAANVLIPRLEKYSGLTAGVDFGVAVHPEFLREGSGIADFSAPARSVVGGIDRASTVAAARLCAGLGAPVYRVSLEVAEMIKYADNALHALKVGFANELAAVASAVGVDSAALFELVHADTTLNLSGAYLRPGFAFGGSCLPKDVRALVHAADRTGVAVPVLGHLLASNDAVLERAVERIHGLGHRRVGVLGLAVKPGTDDLRESPLVGLCRRLLDRGHEVRVFDAAIPPPGPIAAKVPPQLPELPSVLAASAEAVLLASDVVVLGHPDLAPTADLARTLDVPVVDLRHDRAPRVPAEVRRAG